MDSINLKIGQALDCSQCLNGGSCIEYGEGVFGIVITCPHSNGNKNCLNITSSEWKKNHQISY